MNLTQAQQRRLHARRQWRRVPVWQHVCQDCGTPIYAAGICPACAEIRQEVDEVVRVSTLAVEAREIKEAVDAGMKDILEGAACALAKPANVIASPACVTVTVTVDEDVTINPGDLR